MGVEDGETSGESAGSRLLPVPHPALQWLLPRRLEELGDPCYFSDQWAYSLRFLVEGEELAAGCGGSGSQWLTAWNLSSSQSSKAQLAPSR